METETVSPSQRSRPYRLAQRQQAVDETRANIINAVRDLILFPRALAGFSVEAVAKQAAVARTTVYN